MKLSVKQPLEITDCRTTELDGRHYLIFQVVGPRRLLFGTVRGELTFYHAGYKLITTQGKGLTRLNSIDYMTMVERDGQFELQAEMKPNNDSGTKATLRRIAITTDRDVAVTIWRALAEIGFPLGQGITS
ncbi:hypothetical protein CA54_53180 [Symmachiella macrocystis]|uniref:Uncharacterized protein n=1 Tax=Symmachiella macrocystis TaxID=2527985 RepID=A0A5C6B3N7_9PLAN|nr:hypothetical protein [Symmachiella macrocystis]TWU06915.1 hypothetical protein CA54_53180 [Symmachiella macrocystis]